MKKVILAVLMVAAFAGAARADWMITAQAEHDRRQADEIKQKWAALIPAMLAMKYERENIEGRVRAGVATDVDRAELARLEPLWAFKTRGEVVAYSETEEGRRLFADYAERAREKQREIEEWKESL